MAELASYAQGEKMVQSTPQGAKYPLASQVRTLYRLNPTIRPDRLH